MSAARVFPINHDVREMADERARAHAGFAQRGEKISSWSINRGFNPAMVHAVLRGDMKCRIGQAHQIAVELGLKPAPSTAAGE